MRCLLFLRNLLIMRRVQTASEGKLLFTLESLNDTKLLGKRISECVVPGLTLLLEGQLGAGKTTLVREICRELGWKRTCSPSFSLVNEYARARIPVAHADLYRVENADARDFGLDDYLDDGWLLIVEWPERLERADFSEVWHCLFKNHGNGTRTFSVRAAGVSARNALARLEKISE